MATQTTATVAIGTSNDDTPIVTPPHEDVPLPLHEQLKHAVRIVIPTDISNILWVCSQTITLAFVGRNLGEVASAQYSGALVIFNVMGFSLALGLGGALDTIASQAFGSDPRSPRVGESLQLALVSQAIFVVPIVVLFMNAHWFVGYLFNEEVAPGVAKFLLYSPPYLVAQIISGVVAKALYAQELPEVVTIANLAAACTSPVSNYFLTPRGIHGAALSLFLTVGSCCVTYLLCGIFHPKVILREARWPTPTLLSGAAWREFFRLGVPSLIATCAELWAFEVQTILASQISTLALTVHGIAMDLTGLLFSIAIGVCVSASVVVGNLLGSNRPVQAKQFSRFILLFDIVVGAVTAFMMWIFGNPIARLFVTADEVVEALTSMMPLVALTHFGDSLQFCLQGIYKGAGKPDLAAVAVLATLWCVGVPASLILVKVLNVGVKGCIGGLLIGFVFEIPLLTIIYSRFDWEALAADARKRNAMDGVVVEPLSPQADAHGKSFVWPPVREAAPEGGGIHSRELPTEDPRLCSGLAETLQEVAVA